MGELSVYVTDFVQNYGLWLGAFAGVLVALDRVGALLEVVAAKTANPYDDKIASIFRMGGKLANWLALKFK